MKFSISGSPRKGYLIRVIDKAGKEHRLSGVYSNESAGLNALANIQAAWEESKADPATAENFVAKYGLPPE